MGAISAQDLVWRTHGGPGRYIYGFISVIGDMNMDGHEDVVAILHGSCNSSRDFGGYVWVISGRDGVFLYELESATPSSQIWDVTSAGDFNDDGIADFATVQVDPYGPIYWNGPQNFTLVHDGSNGSVLMQYPGNFEELRILSDLDVDGDGLEDMIISASRANSYLGTVRVYSHHGNLLYRLDGHITNPSVLTIGVSLAKLGDINNDNCDDFVMGCSEPGYRGAGVIVSGRDGTYLRICYGELPGDVLGYSVDAAGDLDGDGIQDFVLGNGGGLAAARSVMRVFSTATGQPLRQWTEPYWDYGKTVSSRGVDLDGDAMPDFVAGTPWDPVPPSASGAMYAYSGRDGARLHRIPSPYYPPSPSAPAGSWGRVGVLADIVRTPEGSGLMLVHDANAPSIPPSCGGGGAIMAYRGLPRTSRLLGPACAGNLAAPPQVGMRTEGNGVRVHLAKAPANAPAVLMLGLSTTQHFSLTLPFALDPLGLPGCFLRTSIEAVYLTVTGNTGIDAGYAYLDLPHPVPAFGNGTFDLSAQWLVLGDAATFPGGITEAVTWRR